MGPSIIRKSLSIMALGTIGLLGACQTNYGADIHNQTSTPVFAQIMVKANDRNQPAVVGASRRLGPGDRGSVGPVRGSVNPGSAYLIVDSLPNPSRPASADLRPGTAFVTVTNADDGSLRITEK
jgi:hypothetical protein